MLRNKQCRYTLNRWFACTSHRLDQFYNNKISLFFLLPFRSVAVLFYVSIHGPRHTNTCLWAHANSKGPDQPSLSANRIIGHGRMYRDQMPGWDFAHARNECAFCACFKTYFRLTWPIWCLYLVIRLIPYLPYVFGQTGLSKQYRPRWDAAEHGVSSGSTLFATHPAVLDTTSGSELYWFKF